MEKKKIWGAGTVVFLAIAIICIYLSSTEVTTEGVTENCDLSSCGLPVNTVLSAAPVQNTTHQMLPRDEIPYPRVNDTQSPDAIYANTDSEVDTPEPDSEVEGSLICLVNGDCGLGYACYEGRCKPGCSKHQDCPSGYQCRYGRYGYRCFEKTGWHRECRAHLRVCSRHLQCCSGLCERRRGDMLCRVVTN